jgi:hypothetical protein
MNPPLRRFGTTATHFADPRISEGMPLSGVAMISFNTVAADSSRLDAASEAKATLESVTANNTTRSSVFIISSR